MLKQNNLQEFFSLDVHFLLEDQTNTCFKRFSVLFDWKCPQPCKIPRVIWNACPTLSSNGLQTLTWLFHQGYQWWLHWYAPGHSRESSPRLQDTAQWRLWTPKTCSVGCWLESARPLLGRHLSHPPSLPCNRVLPAWWRYCYCCYFHSAGINWARRQGRGTKTKSMMFKIQCSGTLAKGEIIHKTTLCVIR